MTTLAHQRLAAPTTPEAVRPDRTALYQAAEAASPPASAPLWRRLRSPFAPRRYSVQSLIRKHRLWPALEFVHDALVREFGRVRVRMSVSGEDERFPYVWLDIRVPSVDTELMLDLEDVLSEMVQERFGRGTWLRLSITVNPDPDHLPLFA